MVDVLVVPQGLEERVGEAEDQDVLDRVLAEVVIDAVELVFVEDGMEVAVETPGALRDRWPKGFSTMTLRHPVAPVEAGSAELAGDDREELRRCGQVEKDVAPRPGRPLGVVQ